MADEIPYRELDAAGKLAWFDRATAHLKKSHEAGEDVTTALVIAVRHFTHPTDYALGREFMRRAATIVGDRLEPDGTWTPCRGELWLGRALKESPTLVPVAQISEESPDSQDKERRMCNCEDPECPGCYPS